MDNFLLLNQLIVELNKSNSTLDKINILSKPEYNNIFIKEVLKAVHNPFKQYYITSKNLKKRCDLKNAKCSYTSLLQLLDVLSSRKITGHEAICETNAFIDKHIEFKDIIYNVFDRNLKTRMSEKLINKVFPELIPSFEVALANKYDDNIAKKIDFIKEDYYASRKMDGLRGIAIIDNHDIKIYSRSGKEFFTLDVIKEELQKLNLTNVVLDGEICIMKDDLIIEEREGDQEKTFKKDNEDFQSILKEYNKKNHTIKNPKFKIFDFIDINSFMNRKSNNKLSERLKYLEFAFHSYKGNVLDIVKQTKVKSIEHLIELTNQAKNLGWEGIMIRKDCPYEGKRSNNLLKCKSFHDAEYIVKDISIGPFRVIVNGLEVTENIMRNVLIEHRGFPVEVGSGFSINERRYYKDHPDEIIGKEITVTFFEETTNQNGEISLRFPTIKAIYKNKRDV